MKRQPRSQKRRIVRRLRGTGEGASAVAAEIGSRVFPFRSPPASMPSVEARRSTRAFLPKASTSVAVKPRDGPPRIKRLILPKILSDRDSDDWLQSFGAPGGTNWWNVDSKKQASAGLGAVKRIEPVAMVRETCIKGAEEPLQMEPVMQEATAPPPPRGKTISRFYTRKRRRCRYDEPVAASSKDRKYGIVYIRKKQRRKHRVESLPAEALVEMGILEAPVETGLDDRGQEDAEMRMVISDSARTCAYKAAGISGDDICVCSDSPVMLVVLVESSCRGGSCCFSRILTSIMYWMGRPGTRLRGLAAILFSESLAGFFDRHGVHFLPIRWQKVTALSRNDVLGCGLCKLYSAGQPIPLLTLNFSAVPLYFKSLHAALFLASEYLPAFLTRDLRESIHPEEYDAHVPERTGFPRTGATIPVPPLKLNASNCAAEALELVTQTVTVVSGFSHHNPQKKRSKSRSRVDRSSTGLPLQASLGLCSNSLVEPVHVKPLEGCVGGLVSGRVEEDVPSPDGPPQKYKKIEGAKDLKLALSEVRKNIDSISCWANILVTEPDRCRREEGAEIMLGTSDSEEWCIVVKMQGKIRYMQKPHDWKTYNTNRVTRAPIWLSDGRWRLEFSDKWESLVFKELHTECYRRNHPDIPVKVIPVPGVQVVSGYDQTATFPFVRPSIYICTRDDETERAITSNVPIYDMDSGDEEWLKQLNSSSFDSGYPDVELISEDMFEKIIFTLEKDAYRNPADISNKERALEICQDLGKRDLVAAVYDYWLKKRNKKRAPLVKVFQGMPAKRPAFASRSFSRKKRSSNRQRNLGGRGKAKAFLQGVKRQEDVRKAKEAEKEASEALQKAIHLRSRAQMYMANADLAAYKSVMALRIAEAKRVTGSQDSLFHS